MVKLVAISLTCAIIIIYLKNIKSELAIFAEIMSVIIIVYYGLDYIKSTFEFVNVLIEMSKLDKELYSVIFKAVGVGYLIEFAADIVEDFGIVSLSNKLILVGRVIILGMSMPIIYAIFNLVTGMLQ